MDSGKLRHYVTFEQLVTTLADDSDDDSGAQRETWEPAFLGQQISAEIAPLSGREFVAAQAVQPKVNTRITIRYRPGVEPSMRVRHRNTVYAIQAVLPDAQSGTVHLTLMCESGVTEG